MRPNKNRPLDNYVGIPAVVSETRPFYTVAHLPAEVIAGNQLLLPLTRTVSFSPLLARPCLLPGNVLLGVS